MTETKVDRTRITAGYNGSYKVDRLTRLQDLN